MNSYDCCVFLLFWLALGGAVMIRIIHHVYRHYFDEHSILTQMRYVI